ncbi:hypothetical protein GPECTOR_2g1488 [Gonium pectorale]|uniref:Uncharacterized protein n=1 Tax=Gonium pectorale TaxID=33097 RepID=A0A150H1A5_GONPE|nr:hypothetical protein GPECTOR_2g1488 [Gonium pectorale]|eukprot:KXZ55937.1 hypothetical protein GPECTOR_2g1488 [Gonium pectorale]
MLRCPRLPPSPTRPSPSNACPHPPAHQTKLSYKYRRRTHSVAPALEESYLRLDVSCGSEACDACRVGASSSTAATDGGSFSSSAAVASAAPPPPPSSSLSASAPHYLIPDAEALSDWLELFELPDITNVVLLDSAIKKVRGRVRGGPV